MVKKPDGFGRFWSVRGCLHFWISMDRMYLKSLQLAGLGDPRSSSPVMTSLPPTHDIMGRHSQCGLQKPAHPLNGLLFLVAMASNLVMQAVATAVAGVARGRTFGPHVTSPLECSKVSVLPVTLSVARHVFHTLPVILAKSEKPESHSSIVVWCIFAIKTVKDSSTS